MHVHVIRLEFPLGELSYMTTIYNSHLHLQ